MELRRQQEKPAVALVCHRRGNGLRPVVRVRAAARRGLRAANLKPESLQHPHLLHGRLGQLPGVHPQGQACGRQVPHPEDREQKPLVAHTGQAAGPEDHLFFQVGVASRHGNRAIYKQILFSSMINQLNPSPVGGT